MLGIESPIIKVITRRYFNFKSNLNLNFNSLNTRTECVEVAVEIVVEIVKGLPRNSLPNIKKKSTTLSFENCTLIY
ncbi:MAG: hypothetical protein ACI9XB_005126 [Gammaproteobacteria bacterium]